MLHYGIDEQLDAGGHLELLTYNVMLVKIVRIRKRFGLYFSLYNSDDQITLVYVEKYVEYRASIARAALQDRWNFESALVAVAEVAPSSPRTRS